MLFTLQTMEKVLGSFKNINSSFILVFQIKSYLFKLQCKRLYITSLCTFLNIAHAMI